MPGVVLLCGRSFSGKSTVAGYLAEGLAGELISLDALNAERGLWGGDGIPIEEWARTMDLAHDRVTSAVRLGATVIVDDTSSPAFLRERWRRRAAELAVQLVLVYLTTDEATIRARLAANRADPRRGDVTDAVLTEHLATFEPPTPDEGAVVVDAGSDPQAVINEVRAALGAEP